jgi:hypothetical protein
MRRGLLPSPLGLGGGALLDTGRLGLTFDSVAFWLVVGYRLQVEISSGWIEQYSPYCIPTAWEILLNRGMSWVLVTCLERHIFLDDSTFRDTVKIKSEDLD